MLRPTRRMAAGAVALTVLLGACGGDESSQDDRSSTSESTTAPQVPSAAELGALAVSPPDPFAQQPDDVLDTGLMEPGHPDSGTIGIGYAQEDDLVDAGLVRGWEKYFRSPEEAVVVGRVFAFDSDEGPLEMVERFDQLADPGYERFSVPGVPGGIGYSGVSPEGRSALAGAAAHGRYLIGFTVGGPPGAHDYAALMEALMQEQFAALPDS